MIKTVTKLFVTLSFSALVCFSEGDKFCINPEFVVAVVKGVKGTMIITTSGEFITNEDYTNVALKLGAPLISTK